MYYKNPWSRGGFVGAIFLGSLPDSTTRGETAAAGALLVLGQRRSRDCAAYVRARRSSNAPLHRISGVGCLGRRAHLFPDQLREPVLRHVATGTGISDQTSAGASAP